MSSNDNISKPFESVPKLSGKENYVVWKQRLTLALILTRSNSFIDPNTKVPADTRSIPGRIETIRLRQPSSPPPLRASSLLTSITSMTLPPNFLDRA